MSVGLIILAAALGLGAGAASRLFLKPSWAKKYSIRWSNELGTLKTDLPYGDGEANKFDLYLPEDSSREAYGLAVFLHAGGFTSGDKKEDASTLAWLCSKGYVACGINYTLRTETNSASVLSQSEEIKAAIPKVIEAAEGFGYPIDRMTIAGGSAGHALAMIYAYRDAKEAPVPVVFCYGAVGPSCFYQEDWAVFGLDKSDEGCANLFGLMAGVPISPEEIRDGSYLEKVKPIAAAEWITDDAPPTVAAYGAHDRMQAFPASLRLKAALEEHHVDHQYFALPHSGHGLQNDPDLFRQWMESVESYLDRYMPVEG